MKPAPRTIILSLVIGLLPVGWVPSLAQAPRDYVDYRNEVVTFPLGQLSFADRVVDFNPGSRAVPQTEADPAAALGEPNYQTAGDGRAYTLGCHGSVTYEFIDNALVDAEGPDLYVFEVGKDVEPTDLALSKDGAQWVEIGGIAGGRTSIDLGRYGLAGEDFRFIRLTDKGGFCDSNWPGADIDAVGAIGSAYRFSLSGNVLFDFNRFQVRDEARKALDELLAKLGEIELVQVSIVGHADSQGTSAYNQSLSEQRAGSVADYLILKNPDLAGHARVVGRGEGEPITSNETDQGRAANRRVEVIVSVR